MKYTILNDFKEQVIKCRRKKMRLRAIFQKTRRLRNFEGISDLMLLNSLVVALRELGLVYSIKEVYSAFSLVDKEDYPAGQKKKVLGFLTKGAENKSVF
jgi:hypothetical protein